MAETNTYYIFADSACDLPEELTATYENFDMCCLSFTIDGETDPKITIKEFYDRLRKGSRSKTSQVSVGTFLDHMRPVLQAGHDILYVGFSSGLSGTVESGMSAAEMLRKEFPERKIIVVDTRSASCGYGLLVDKAVENRGRGMTIEENAKWLEDNKFHVHHLFTVDDLHFLQRGGRVSVSAAWFGTALQIKPYMNMDKAGHLIPREKVIGRKRSIRRMFEKMQEFIVDPKPQKVFISHGDCMDDVEYLKSLITAEWGITNFVVSYVGHVIGSHTGPGVLALYFMGVERED